MTREEVEEIYDIVKQEIENLSDIPNIYEAIVCGSYRRFDFFNNIIIFQHNHKNMCTFIIEVNKHVETLI